MTQREELQVISVVLYYLKSYEWTVIRLEYLVVVVIDNVNVTNYDSARISFAFELLEADTVGIFNKNYVRR